MAPFFYFTSQYLYPNYKSVLIGKGIQKTSRYLNGGCAISVHFCQILSLFESVKELSKRALLPDDKFSFRREI